MPLFQFPTKTLAVAIACLAPSFQANAQDTQSGDAAPPEPVEVPAAAQDRPVTETAAREVYTAADFARFAPRNALDIVNQIPGFRVEGGGGGGRGFGQADGNLLINGERVSSKSTSTAEQLSRIPVDNVIRIEVVDGATLDIPGLSGRVANIIVRQGGASGQFEWQPSHSTGEGRTILLEGEASITGALAGVDYTVAIENNAFGRGQRGPVVITDALGAVDARESTQFDRFDRPSVSGTFAFDPAPQIAVRLNLSGGIERYRSRESEIRLADPLLPDFDESLRAVSDEWFYEIGGDVTLPLGPGQLKLIALESYEHKDRTDSSLLDIGILPTRGSRFRRIADIGERIGRGEYNWAMWGADWQLSGEAAFNRLDQDAELFTFDPDTAEYVQVDFPQGAGGVREDRYEGLLSVGFPVLETLSLQLIGGAEYSIIAQSGSNALSRSFLRPKGSLLAAWAPAENTDISLQIARRVGQLDFGDFLASVSLDRDQENSGNNRLRPQQSWEIELEAARDFGRWGSATVALFDQYIEDLVLIVPVEGGGAARGNIDSARRYGIGLTGTLEFEPLGWRGAKLDARVAWEDSSLDDPVTGLARRFDGIDPFDIEFNLRHDVPDTDWAWGANFRDRERALNYRVTETFFNFRPSTELGVFAEHKDVLGTTVRLDVSNIKDGANVFSRTVFAGPRGEAPVLFTEDRRRRSGPQLQLTVSGGF